MNYSPYVKVYHKTVELSLAITDFVYEYHEEKNDEAQITIQSEFAEIADLPAFQEGAKLELIWGLIGETKFTRRIVFVTDLDISFEEKGVIIIVKATDKAAQLKLVNDKFIPPETTLVGLQVMVGEMFGLNTPTKSNDETYSNSLGNDPNSFNLALSTEDIQANRNYYVFLQDIANRAENGPVIVEGRDEDLRIFKRNLNQKPIKQFNYKGDEGLLSFKIKIQNKAKQGDSSNIRVDSWDPENKTMNSSDINYGSDDETQLGQVVDKSQRWIGGADLGNTSTKGSSVVISKIDKYNLDYGQDPENIDLRTLSQFSGNNQLQGYFERGSYIVPRDNTVAPLMGFAMPFPQDASKFNLSAEHSHDAAVNETLNQKKKASLEKNEAKAVFRGDCDIMCGKIITILGASKKYSGNYYIKSSIHKLKPKEGWTVKADLVRNALGKNNNENDFKADVNEANMFTNTKLPSGDYKDTIAIPDEYDTLPIYERGELKVEQSRIDNTKVKINTDITPPEYKIIDSEATPK